MGAPIGYGGMGAGGGASSNQPQGGGASLSDILTSIQNLVVATNGLVNANNAFIPHNTTGQLTANTLVQAGFMRLTGFSVMTAGAQGTLHDAMNLASAGSGNIIGVVPATLGFTPVNMVFVNGLVYKPGAAQIATLFYTRT